MDNWVRKTAGCIGVGLIATLGLAQDFDIRYVIETGASYPLRYGQAESGDEVTPQLSITKPTCFIRGTNTKLQIIDPQSKVLQWKVVQFELEGIPNAVDPTESYTWYWNQTSGFLTPAQQADLPAFPNHIEYCQVSAEFLMEVIPEQGGGGEGRFGPGQPVWRRYRLTDRDLIEIPERGEPLEAKEADEMASEPLEALEMSAALTGLSAGEECKLDEQYANQKVYLVLGEPTAPMDPAWASLLKYPCSWASKDTTGVDAAKEVTFGVFWHPGGFAYPSDTGSYWIRSSKVLYLADLLDEFDSPVHGNCLDASAMDVVCKNALGLEYSLRQLTSDPESDETNSICLIGSDATNYSYYYVVDNWAWHSIAVPGGSSFSDSTPVFSACEAHWVDLGGNTYKNPPADHSNHAWTQKDYWQKPLGNSWVGLWRLPDDLHSTGNPIRYSGIDSGDWIPTVSTEESPWTEDD